MMMINQYIEETKLEQAEADANETDGETPVIERGNGLPAGDVLDSYEALSNPDPRDPRRLREKNIGDGETLFVGSGEPAPKSGLYQTEAPSVREVEVKAGDTMPDLDGHGQLWRLHQEFVDSPAVDRPSDLIGDSDGE